MRALRRVLALFALTLMVSCLSIGSPSWPTPRTGSAVERPAQPADASTTDDTNIVRTLPVCVASRSWSAGELGQSVLFHFRREGRKLTVGYFVYWTTERPWGENALSYSVLPAFFIDAFYSHLFFLFPGAQRVLFGPGDVEGARVVYEQEDDGRWTPVSAVANDAFHHEVALAPYDFIDTKGRVVLLTDVWSHQLGASGARSLPADRRDRMTCFGGDSISPLTDEIASVFRLGSSSNPRRAGAAWKIDSGPKRVAVGATPEAPQMAGILR